MTLVLMDTNMLLRGAEPAHPMHAQAIEAQVALRRRGKKPCLVAQNLVEFRSVATRPSSANGMGMSQSDADNEIARLKALYAVFADDATILSTWERLVTTHGSVGKQNHDARIVAAMLAHQISTLLTFNKSDFTRYSEIEVCTPQEVLVSL